ncbi:MAG: hypothetical protein ACREQV_11595, partial [Candidatus Binatia bacterium]
MAEDSNYWSRFTRKRYGRRRLIQMGAIGAGGLAAAAAVGCGDDDDDDDDDVTAEVTEEEATAAATEAADDDEDAEATEVPSGEVSAVLEDYRTRFNYRNLASVPGQTDSDPTTGGTFRFSTYAGVTGFNLLGPEGDTLASFAPNHFSGLLGFA